MYTFFINGTVPENIEVIPLTFDIDKIPDMFDTFTFAFRIAADEHIFKTEFVKEKCGKSRIFFADAFSVHNKLICAFSLSACDVISESAVKDIIIKFNYLFDRRIFFPRFDGRSDIIFDNGIHFVETVADKKVLDRQVINVDVAPRETAKINIETNEPYAANEVVIRFAVCLKDKTNYADAGHVVYNKAFALECEKQTAKKPEKAPELIENRADYTVRAGGFEYVIRKDTGVITKIKSGEKELVDTPIEFTVWRMPTDNDNKIVGGDNGTEFGRGAGQNWRKTPEFGEMPYPWLEVEELSAKIDGARAVISGRFIFAVPGRKHITEGFIEYIVDGDGTLTLSQKGAFNEALPFFLARYGYRFNFKDKISDVDYFGLGPEECYEDKCEYATLGWYGYLPDDPKNSYEKPQECNSRTGCRRLSFKSADTRFTVSSKSFSFCVTEYDINECYKYLHKKDMPRAEGAYLHLDYRMSGVGSTSCGGDDAQPECRINPGEKFDFGFVIKPEKV